MKYFLKLFLLLTCPVCISASEINQTTFAYWNKPDVEIYFISPDVIDENTKVIFVIHGNSRNAEDYLSEWRPYIAKKNVIVVAPKFTKESFKYFALLEMAQSSGKVNRHESEYINNSISLIFNFIKSKFSLNTQTYDMFGHSAGAQFIHRYMLLSDDKRISNAVIANAGWYTFISDAEFPYGIKNSPIKISNDHMRWYAASKVNLLIGSDDVGFKSLNTSKGAQIQGNNRFERANSFFNTLIKEAEKNNYVLRWNFKVLDDIDHDYKKLLQ
jgi:pimeloyl-ACP methyl ester carboxylesterase